MITQTYIFKDLPKEVVEDDDEKGLKWSRGIEKDIYFELGHYLNTRWEPSGEREVTLRVSFIDESEAERLELLLNNLHQGIKV